MPSSSYTTAAITELVKNLEAIPTNQNTFTDQDFADLMNHSLQNDIVPILMKTNEEYFVTFDDITVDSNERYITAPANAIGMRFRDIWWINGSNSYTSLPRIAPEVAAGGTFTFNSNYGWNGAAGYYLQGNRAVFTSNFQNPGTLRVFYFRRPNILLPTIYGARITAINPLNNTVTVDTSVDGWAAGVELDAIHEYQPFDFAYERAEIVSINGVDIEFSPDVIADLSVGDWLTQAGYSVFPQYIPIEAHGVLAQGTALKCLQSLNDTQAIEVAAAVFNQQKKDLLDLITPRVQGQAKKIGSTGRGLMYTGGYNRSGFNNL